MVLGNDHYTFRGRGYDFFFFFFLCKYHIFYQVKNLFFVNNLILQFTDRNVDKIL